MFRTPSKTLAALLLKPIGFTQPEIDNQIKSINTERACGSFLCWASNGGHGTVLFIPYHLYDVGRAGSSAGSQWLIQSPAHVTMYSERLGAGSQSLSDTTLICVRLILRPEAGGPARG